MKRTVILYNAVQGWTEFCAFWVHAKALLVAGHRLVLEVREEKRSDPQNRRMWAMLHEISRQVNWHGLTLTDEEWKDVFTAALKRQKVVPGLDGGFVVCGQRTSKMSKAEVSDLMELMSAFAAERDVVFKDLEAV